MPQLTLTPEQQLLQDNARQLIRAAAPVGQLRRLRDQTPSAGLDLALWRELAQLGWAGAIFPEAYGGSELGHTELGVVLEACGATLAATPLLSSVLLGGGAILAAGSDAHKRELLPAIASGKLLVALAFEERPRFAPHHVQCSAERHGDQFRLTGHKSFVIDGHSADKLVVSARTSGQSHERAGISLFLVDAHSPGIRLRRTALLDSHCAATLAFEATSVPATALLGKLDQGADLLDRVLDRATVALCAELLGLVSQAYEITLEYLRTRVQFDALIGSFQALQHRAVDMFVEVELLRSTMILAAIKADDESAEERKRAISIAKAQLAVGGKFVVQQAVQLHGGVGVTDEHDVGLYFKRMSVLNASYGDEEHHLTRYTSRPAFTADAG